MRTALSAAILTFLLATTHLVQVHTGGGTDVGAEVGAVDIPGTPGAAQVLPTPNLGKCRTVMQEVPFLYSTQLYGDALESIALVPQPQSTPGILNGLVGWGVGGHRGPGPERPLIRGLHVDTVGAYSWQPVSFPFSHPYSTSLKSVAARTNSDAWAVGYSQDALYSGQPFASHWNGAQWQEVAVPNPAPSSGFAKLNAVKFGPGGDVWASGFYVANFNQNYPRLPFMVRYDPAAGAWSAVALPAPLYDDNRPERLEFMGNDMWVVGNGNMTGDAGSHPFVLQKQGASWNYLSLPPELAVGGSYISSMSGSGSGADMWISGYTPAGNYTLQPLFFRYRSSSGSWENIALPPQAAGLFAAPVAASADGNVWMGLQVSSGKPSGMRYAPQSGTYIVMPVTPDPHNGTGITTLATSGSNVWMGGSYWDPSIHGLQSVTYRAVASLDCH
ncbi:MAG: hypothetical protein ABI670_01075 [Chloroflexota bacterium]